MTVTAPRALGRGVVIEASQPVPAGWDDAPLVVVDDTALADPGQVVAFLHAAWASRTPVVVALAVDPGRFRAPRSYTDDELGPSWRLDPGFDLAWDRLHFLVWANTYDARAEGDPVWWWGRKAERLGAARAPDPAAGDVVLPGGEPAWVDGGPRGGLGPADVGGTAVVAAESVDVGSLAPVPPPAAGSAIDLAPDQRAAVTHGAGPARVIAPAGSGKTRVLTERLRHLVVDRGYEPASVVAVAYNRKARDEMVARTAGVGGRILTLNALGYDILAAGLGRRPEVLEVRDVRRLLEPLVPRTARRLNTDPLAPYVEALSAVRLGLRDPIDVEDERGDVPGLAEAFPAYRDALARRGVVDFDEQVLGSIELLLHDGEFRRAQQARHRHLLVDEFQDLTPAHVLLVRLLSAPALDVFGVGDDDQVIYGHAGASPRFLTEFGRYFPGADEHALEVNYRCPPAVVDAARHLLTRNRVRVDKTIRAARQGGAPDDLRVVRHPPDAGAAALVDVVRGWLAAAPAVGPGDVAVLARVGSSLLAPHVALVEAGVPVASILRADVLDRTGVRAALAYLRIAADPEHIVPDDLTEVHRRPSRGLPRWIDKWLGRCRSIDDVERAAERIDDVKVSTKLVELAADLRELAALAGKDEGTSRAVLEQVRDNVGLARAVDLLDATGGGEGQNHRDDLDALLQVADLHPDPAGFEPWLRSALGRPGDEAGVTLSTVHRVKGREWPRVALFGASDGLMPHRLAQGRAAVEEERRVFHVAITRGIGEVAVLADASRPSPFLDELAADATPDELAEADRQAELAAVAQTTGSAAGGRGERRPRAPVPAASGPEAARVEQALRAWRKQRSKDDGVAAFIVLSDRHLMGIAERRPVTTRELAACPGIGPAKLDAYGDELLALVAAAVEGGGETTG
ncbi:MAG TPA: ATP-dependent DNA helicase UvrD2 [Acidimicrobiales bacterium]|nr:ATP-dependent DNA helicase UvrD2 [Acidimicrobiales bacterium]